MQFLCGEQGKTLAQVKAHLVRKYGERTGAGAVSFLGAVRLHVAHEIEILLHGVKR